jgi:hypothetical protein
VIVELISEGQPIRLQVSQLIVFNDEGTPVAVAGLFGPGAIKAAHVLDADFQQTLKTFGYGRHQVEVQEIQAAPVPGGAKLITGPGGG